MTKPKKLPSSTDAHYLYQEAVQSPDVDVRILDRHFRRTVGRPARLFREDFCGTALFSCEWVKLSPDRRAIAIDIDAATLRWGERHNLSALSENARERIELIHADVLDIRRPKADIIGAFNFSYCVLKSRPQMLEYVKNARRSLNRDGMLIMDVWGGSATQTEHYDRRRLRGCTYFWDQLSFDPISYHAQCRIRFEFPNGLKLRNAFTYDWRLWTLPELRDILLEAGFDDIHVLWESSDKTGKGTGVFRRVDRVAPEDSWVAYIVGSV